MPRSKPAPVWVMLAGWLTSDSVPPTMFIFRNQSNLRTIAARPHSGRQLLPCRFHGNECDDAVTDELANKIRTSRDGNRPLTPH